MNKNRIPTIKVESDDFTMDFAGEEYTPHTEEYVRFVPYLSTSDTLQMLDAIEGFDEDEAETRDVLRAISDKIVPVLLKVIDCWTWTHVMTGAPLGVEDGSIWRPTLSVLNDLSPSEQSYLISAYFEARGGKDEEDQDPQ